jgi:hypothetical protein
VQNAAISTWQNSIRPLCLHQAVSIRSTIAFKESGIVAGVGDPKGKKGSVLTFDVTSTSLREADESKHLSGLNANVSSGGK